LDAVDSGADAEVTFAATPAGSDGKVGNSSFIGKLQGNVVISIISAMTLLFFALFI